MRVIFLGTPEIATPTLKALIESSDHEVVAVVAQPDRPAGRGNKMHEPPVITLAKAHNIKCFQPESLSKAPDVVEAMAALKPDVFVMIAFGQLLKKPVLEMAPFGVINIHASLLPKYRGAAPINWSIINGETVTGVTTMQTEAGLDTGPMLLRKNIVIDSEMTAIDLADQVAHVGAQVLLDTLKGLKDGSVRPETQNDSEHTLAPRLSKETGKIDWNKSAKQIHDLVRGLLPWPGAYALFRGSALKITKTIVGEAPDRKMRPGFLILKGDHLSVVCGEGQETLNLVEVQPANRSRMSARDWANGQHLNEGDFLD